MVMTGSSSPTSQPQQVVRENHAELPLSSEGAPKEFSAAGFFGKLVLLPAAVVGLLVAIALFSSWATVSTADVEQLVEQLNRPGRARWQAAWSLANLLADPDDDAIRRNRSVALQLCGILHRELEHRRPDRESVLLRVYLARALGQFHLTDVLPVLLEAASDRSSGNLPVRSAAIESLAVLAHNLGPQVVRQDKQLVTALAETAEDPSADLRARAAYALGLVGGYDASRVLVPLLRDADFLVRCNAATALARCGNPEAVPVLMEMLAPADDAPTETADQSIRMQRDRLALTAIRALEMLADKISQSQVVQLCEQLQSVAGGTCSRPVRVAAIELLAQLRQQTVAENTH